MSEDDSPEDSGEEESSEEESELERVVSEKDDSEKEFEEVSETKQSKEFFDVQNSKEQVLGHISDSETKIKNLELEASKQSSNKEEDKFGYVEDIRNKDKKYLEDRPEKNYKNFIENKNSFNPESKFERQAEFFHDKRLQSSNNTKTYETMSKSEFEKLSEQKYDPLTKNKESKYSPLEY